MVDEVLLSVNSDDKKLIFQHTPDWVMDIVKTTAFYWLL